MVNPITPKHPLWDEEKNRVEKEEKAHEFHDLPTQASARAHEVHSLLESGESPSKSEKPDDDHDFPELPTQASPTAVSVLSQLESGETPPTPPKPSDDTDITSQIVPQTVKSKSRSMKNLGNYI